MKSVQITVSIDGKEMVNVERKIVHNKKTLILLELIKRFVAYQVANSKHASNLEYRELISIKTLLEGMKPINRRNEKLNNHK